MKKVRKTLLVSVIILLIISTIFSINAYAEDNPKSKKVEYSEAYKKWMELSEEEKSKTVEPMKYDIKFTNNSKNTSNIMKLNQKLKASLTPSYDLRKIIPENVVVRDQMNTNACWAFATIGSLESSLAMKNYKQSLSKKIYDFSEMHMNYATARTAFLNGAINKKGINRNVSEGGSAMYALAYLTNGSGAIKESDMPYEDTEENIDIARIENKDVVTTLNNVNIYMGDSGLKNTIKEYIKEYGGISAQIHGDDIVNSKCYNNATGAIYCNNNNDSNKHTIDHAVLIIGWDDTYPIDNFNENSRPQNSGAWIIKNSWGKDLRQTYTLDDIRQEIFNANSEELISLGYNSPSDIPQSIIDSQLDTLKLIKNDDGTYDYVISIGDNGYMYVSYEDINIYSCLWGIRDAEDMKNYDNIYQNDELGFSANVKYELNSDRIYIANVFDRSNISYAENLNKISIMTLEEYDNCKVYVNPNGSSRNKNELKEVKLSKGENVTVTPGYTTLEFEKPVSLQSDKYAVVLEFDNSTEGKNILVESNKETGYEDAVVNNSESFVGILGTTTEIDTASDVSGNICLKAFTNKKSSNNQTGEEEQKNDENTEEINKKSILSNFDNAIADMKDARLDVSTNNIENSSAEATIKVSNIVIGDEDANYKYSYYISDTIGDTNIKEEYWNEIDDTLVKEADGTYSLTIHLDSNDLKNYSEITNENNLYIYIKEVGTKESLKEEKINTLKIKMNSTPSVNIDGKDAGNINDIIKSDNVKNEKSAQGISSTDSTIASKILPYTGYIPVIAVSFVIILIIGIFTYTRYKNIDK